MVNPTFCCAASRIGFFKNKKMEEAVESVLLTCDATRAVGLIRAQSDAFHPPGIHLRAISSSLPGSIIAVGRHRWLQ